MLPAEYRMRSGNDFKHVFRQGKKIPGRYLVVHICKVDDTTPKIGFVVSRSVGNAVVRNRVKRRLRAAMHTRLLDLNSGSWIVVRALPQSAGVSWSVLTTDLDKSLNRSGFSR